MSKPRAAASASLTALAAAGWDGGSILGGGGRRQAAAAGLRRQRRSGGGSRFTQNFHTSSQTNLACSASRWRLRAAGRRSPPPSDPSSLLMSQSSSIVLLKRGSQLHRQVLAPSGGWKSALAAHATAGLGRVTDRVCHACSVLWSACMPRFGSVECVLPGGSRRRWQPAAVL